MKIHNAINMMKNMRLTELSILKYFVGCIQLIFCIITDSNLPQSNAGIGNILNIASARDIMAANIRSIFDPPVSHIWEPIFAAHTGQLTLSRACCLSF
jgi:hypothetical protein